MPELIYVIPPYLLNTSLGAQLQAKLSSECKDLGKLNVISTDSTYYQGAVNAKPEAPKGNFSKDKVLNDIIMNKVRYKLAIIGVLGNNPMEQLDETHLRELFTIFERKILPSEDTAKDDATEDENNWGDIGEVAIYSDNIPESHVKYLDYSLKDLLHMVRHTETPSAFIPSGFVKSDAGKQLEFPFPTSWSPLFEKKFLKFFSDSLNLNVSSDAGYRTINMHVDDKLSSADLRNPVYLTLDTDWRSKYFNFVGDKAVAAHTGIFYYEVEVEQEATESTNFKLLLLMNDSFILADRSLNLSVGYIKRNIQLHGSKVDLDEVLKDITEENPILDITLNTRPGELKGSVAISYEDLAFYNSAKTLDRVSNLNRRLSTRNHSTSVGPEKTDLGVPFKTKLTKDTPAKKIYKTDVVGCGINFINKSIFITLNGVLVKVISEGELKATNSTGEGLFTPSQNLSVFPIIGFKLSEVAIDAITLAEDGGTSVQIRTNFGFREFHFNVTNYVQNFKEQNNRKILQLTSLNSATKGAVDSQKLNQLIKEYLSHEGFLDTYKALNADVEFLREQIQDKSVSDKEDMQTEEDLSTLAKSHTTNRGIIKLYLLSHQYDSLGKFLKLNYPTIFAKNEAELCTMKFVYLLKQLVENPTDENRQAAVEYRLKLQDTVTTQAERIGHLASVLLVKNKQSLDVLPIARAELDNYSTNLTKLFDSINSAVLEHLGFNGKSSLQRIFEGVNADMTMLSTKANDENFMLVNFEKDHLDL